MKEQGEMPGPGRAPLVGEVEKLAAPEKSCAFREILHPAGACGRYFAATVTARRFRPLARRRLITNRPFLVAIRTRNPWVLFRDVLLGWNVLFMTHLPSSGRPEGI